MYSVDKTNFVSYLQQFPNQIVESLKIFKASKINIDKAENIILESLDNKDIQTAKWYLQTIGKQRGYVEKIDINQTGDVNITISLETTDE